MTTRRVPAATYRFQFNASFRLDQALDVADYLSALGISDVYSSPIFTARPGSVHGYDVVDPSQINPEIGGEEAFERLSAALRERNIGFLLDIVPNHMAASSDNRWWVDVLEYGKESAYADYFDVAWEPFTSYNRASSRILLPILGDPYGEVLESQQIRLHFESGSFFLTYYDRRIPISPRTYRFVLHEVVTRCAGHDDDWLNELKTLAADDYFSEETSIYDRSSALKAKLAGLYAGDAEIRNAFDRVVALFNGESKLPEWIDRFDQLLEMQPYRLAYWRMAAEEINYRRFFDVTDLVGVRVEIPEVFEARQRRLFALVAEGKVTGIRIDHIDGLYDPLSYLRRLQSRLIPDSKERFYVVVEKILATDEKLPESFPVDGTTGYDFLSVVNDVFLDRERMPRLDEVYRSFTASEKDFEETAYESKKLVIDGLFAGEMRSLTAMLVKIAACDRSARDFSFAELLQALTEVTACLGVYRTYTRDFHVSPADERSINHALAEAQARAGDRIDERIFEFLRRVLLLQPPRYVQDAREWLDFVMRWQQFTGRAMAKGVEDTAFYIYNRLISQNEVGGEPTSHQDDGVENFHRWNCEQVKQWKHTLNTSSTHDTKRSEDVRARINVLSELVDGFEARVRRWGRTNYSKKKNVHGVVAPDRNEEMLIYQTLLGFWPLDPHDAASAEERLIQFLEKAMREAKVHTSWISPVPEYERAVFDFARSILAADNGEFLEEFHSFRETVSYYGFLNSIAQVVLKATSPGVPDIYQGTELWDFSLVDPDNRRAVDYERRRKLLTTMSERSPEALLQEWRSGDIKMFVTARSLAARRADEELFREGGYEAIPATGAAHRNICAFARTLESRNAIVVVPRLLASLIEPGRFPIGEVWGEHRLVLPRSEPSEWTNVFTGETIRAEDLAAGEKGLALSAVLARFPVALLMSTST